MTPRFCLKRLLSVKKKLLSVKKKLLSIKNR